MGVNNKARRAAKRRRQQVRTSGTTRDPVSGPGWQDDHPRDEAERAARLLSEALIALRFRPASAAAQAAHLTGEIPHQRLAAMLHRLLTDSLVATVRHGWTPSDLAQITKRRLSARHLPLVATLVTEEARRHPSATISPVWKAEMASLGQRGTADLTDVSGVAQALEVLCVLGELPALAQSTPPPGSPQDARRGGGGTEHKMLARVRALLAKAESTEFPEESEALSAKAQQLISAYALNDLAAQVDSGAPAQQLVVRRIWIDAPYVSAKSMLVNAVGRANHCSCVFSQLLGFSTLVGRPVDVDASELLVTSLLVQADRAMLRDRGRDGRPTGSRTTSFRRSFLVSYAIRIGERLGEAAADSLATTARSGELVPVVAQVDERVREATEQLFPLLVEREVRISNAMGWAAGRAAADLAVFTVHGEVSKRAAG